MQMSWRLAAGAPVRIVVYSTAVNQLFGEIGSLSRPCSGAQPGVDEEFETLHRTVMRSDDDENGS